jgi:hypothetical protein
MNHLVHIPLWNTSQYFKWVVERVRRWWDGRGSGQREVIFKRTLL